ncbi:hypothetical protein GF406_18585 [candidate division KSB1 bacterium]|nr:hypothetical protein [candidate division KSB1 bacterium]
MLMRRFFVIIAICPSLWAQDSLQHFLFLDSKSLTIRMPVSASEFTLHPEVANPDRAGKAQTIFVQVVAGEGIALVTALGGLFLGGALANKEGEGPFPASAAYGALTGYIVGAGLWPYFIGKHNGYEGSFFLTMLGSLVGSGSAYLIALETDRGWPVFILPTLVATASFHM